ncbi:unnamed protein product [Acanthoscelides obtectus]|uniref:THAP-type domain-containing protein n=1 Tax=Acanthoscelides obtectus TaxID=200917 RepID=A0A9P0JVS2_ACAOB|nr:unnamed protein product [Acanthoscelides obtectus]CAK1649009.1 DNA transposase THAP9 [Acanthoscelides obtectus]
MAKRGVGRLLVAGRAKYCKMHKWGLSPSSLSAFPGDLEKTNTLHFRNSIYQTLTKMPRRCCVPGCKGNYDTTLKAEDPVSTFSFPKEQELLEKWIRAIPRKDWIPTKSSAVCANHFCDSDIVRFSEFTLPNGQINKIPLKYPKLNQNAVPSKFCNLPKYLSLETKAKRTDPEKRREAIIQRQEEEIENFLKTDIISSFSDLKENFEKQCISNWEYKLHDHNLYFYNLTIVI